MGDIEISIIVPVYNIEKYLNKSIMSMLAQTFINIEVILVDDGATDNSGAICDKFAGIDKRVKVIHQKNSGAGQARNNGLKAAKGNYIGFVDGDDYIEANMYEILYKNIKEYDDDIVMCQVNSVNTKGVIKKTPYNNNMKVNTGKEAIKNYLVNGRWACWDKLYKREVFGDVKFLEGRTCGEDHIVIVPILYKSNKLRVIDEYLYNYLIRDDSTTNNSFSIRNFDEVYVWEQVLKQIESLGDIDLKKSMIKKLYMTYIDIVNSILRNNLVQFNENVKDIIEKLKKLQKTEMDGTNIPFKYKFFGLILVKNITFYGFLLKTLEKKK